MAETIIDNQALFEVRVAVHVSAPPDVVYGVVSDLPRSGEWSVECTGGQWVSGAPATVGAVFRGENHRSPDVVAWAPVVRGDWITESQVVAAEPGRTFRWAMRNRAGQVQQSVWAFDIAPASDGGSELVHHFRMDAPTEGIRGITAEMDDAQKARFFREWGDKVESDMTATLHRIKKVIESE